MFYLYILWLSNKTYYIGITLNLEKRIFEHLCGIAARKTEKQKIKLLDFYTLNIKTRQEAEIIEKCYSYYLGSHLGFTKVTYGHKLNKINLNENVKKYHSWAKPLIEKQNDDERKIKINNIIDAFYEKEKLKRIITHLQCVFMKTINED